jgi:hypothetical protein
MRLRIHRDTGQEAEVWTNTGTGSINHTKSTTAKLWKNSIYVSTAKLWKNSIYVFPS